MLHKEPLLWAMRTGQERFCRERGVRARHAHTRLLPAAAHAPQVPPLHAKQLAALDGQLVQVDHAGVALIRISRRLAHKLRRDKQLGQNPCQ